MLALTPTLTLTLTLTLALALALALALTKVACCSFVLGFVTSAAVGMHSALLVSRPACLHVHVHVHAHVHVHVHVM